MKQVLISCLVLLLLGSTALAQEMFEESDYHLVGQNQKSGEYVNTLLGFKLKPPSGWTIEVRDEDPENIMVEMMSDDEQCTLNLNVVQTSVNPQETVDEVEKTLGRTVVKEGPTTVPVVGTDAALELVTSFSYLDQPFSGRLIVFKKGDRIYKFDGWAPAAADRTLEIAMRAAVDNFTFKKAAAPAKKKTPATK